MTTYNDISTAMAKNLVVATNAFARTEGMPLDNSVVFNNFNDLSIYANLSGNAYEGQIVAVKNNGKQEVYVLDTTVSSGLRKLADADAENLSTWLNKADISSVISGDVIIENHDFKILFGNYI